MAVLDALRAGGVALFRVGYAMNLVRQPDGSSLCGQSCVAMVAGVSLDEAIAAVGHSRARGTTTREVIAALRRLGVPCADRLRRVCRSRPTLPPRVLACITNGGRKWHWLVSWDGVIFDPEDRWPDYDGWRITSYLEILQA